MCVGVLSEGAPEPLLQLCSSLNMGVNASDLSPFPPLRRGWLSGDNTECVDLLYAPTLIRQFISSFLKEGYALFFPSLPGCHNKAVQAGQLKQHDPGGQKSDQDVGRIFLPDPSVCQGNSCLLVSLHDLPSVRICVLMFCSCKGSSYNGLGPTVMTSFYPNYLYETLISRYSHVLRYKKGILQGNSSSHSNYFSRIYFLSVRRYPGLFIHILLGNS